MKFQQTAESQSTAAHTTNNVQMLVGFIGKIPIYKQSRMPMDSEGGKSTFIQYYESFDMDILKKPFVNRSVAHAFSP